MTGFIYLHFGLCFISCLPFLVVLLCQVNGLKGRVVPRSSNASGHAATPGAVSLRRLARPALERVRPKLALTQLHFTLYLTWKHDEIHKPHESKLVGVFSIIKVKKIIIINHVAFSKCNSYVHFHSSLM